MGMRIIRTLVAGLAILSIGSFGADAQAQASKAKAAASVNGEQISQSELKVLLDARPSPVPLSAEQQKQLKQAALDMLIDDALMRQFLGKHTQTPTSVEITKELDDLKEALKKQKKTLEQFLHDSRQSEEHLRKDVVARLRWKSYLTTRFPDSEVKAFYDANKVFFDKVFVKASHILVKVSDNATASERQAAKNKLETLRQEIIGGKMKFADAATKYSECSSKEKGGDIGPFPYKFVVVEPFAKAAFSMKVGEISDLVTTDFGFHIITVTERSAGETSDFNSLRNTIREVIAQDTDLYQRILADQRKAAKIEISAP